MKMMTVVTAGLLCAVSSAQDGDSRENIEYQMMVRRACEAAIWALPAVANYDLELAIKRELGGEVGDIVNTTEHRPKQTESQRDTARFQVVSTPRTSGIEGVKAVSGQTLSITRHASKRPILEHAGPSCRFLRPKYGPFSNVVWSGDPLLAHEVPFETTGKKPTHAVKSLERSST